MPELGSSKFTLRVAGDKFKSGLATAKGQADKTTKGIGKSFSNMQQKIQGAAGKIPVVGSSLAALASPAGLATAGIGLVVGGLTKMVSKTLDVGRRLGELREKLGVSAEGIQIYERAIEEGNGNTAAFEKTTLRLQKTIGDAANGNKAAAAQFDALGLSFEDLADKSPEEALRAVLGAANDTLGPTDRASVLAATLGRSYADLGAFATKGADELTELLDSVKDTAVTMSGDGVTAVDEYDAANRNMRDSFGSIVTEVGMALIPVLTQLFGVIKQLMPIVKVLIAVALVPVKSAVNAISSAINIVSALLRGDFTGALNFARDYFINAATIILEVGAKIVGLFNKDMATAIRGTVADLKAMKVVAETETAPALDKVAEATRKAGEETVTTGNAVAAATPKWREHAATVLTASERLQAYQDKNSKLREEFTMMYPELVKVTEGIAASGDAAETTTFQLAALTKGYMASMRALQALTKAKIEAENQRREDAYNELAGNAGNAPFTQTNPDGSRQSGRPAPGPRNATGGALVWAQQVQPSGAIFFRTENSGNTSYSVRDWPERREAALAWIAANAPGAQHGAFVRGSRMGSLVRVGENFTDENIMPVRGSGINGSGGGSQQPLLITAQLGDTKLADIYVQGKQVAIREHRD